MSLTPIWNSQPLNGYENTFSNTSGKLEPFYFRPSPLDKLFKPSLIALIRPDEFGCLQLPTGWGEWETAEELVV